MIWLAALAIAASAPAAEVPRREYLFQGREEDLEHLVQAAHACGLRYVTVSLFEPHLTPGVLIYRPVERDPRYECTMRWISAHPETGFRVPPTGS